MREPRSGHGVVVRVLQLPPSSYDFEDDAGSCGRGGRSAVVRTGIAGEKVAEFEQNGRRVSGHHPGEIAMSFNRQKGKDLLATRAVLAGGFTNGPIPGKTWLDHGGGAGKIDIMLIGGATKQQMAEARGAVDAHLFHLKVEHGLPVIQVGNKWMFDRKSINPGATGTD